MLRLITGVPGSGKSLRAMWWLEQPEYLDEAGEVRPVYSNIPGTNHLPLPEGDDWRNTPNGSIVIYDEAQQFFPATGKAGNSTDPRIQALETHRHTGHDLIFVTQRYTLIHHHIRALCGRHEHLVKKGRRAAVLFAADEVFEPKDRNKMTNIEESVWLHPKSLFGSYTSASIHTKAQTSRRIPTKLKALAVTLVLLFGVSGYLGYQSFQNIGHVEADHENPQGGGVINTAASDFGSGTGNHAPAKPVPAWQKKGHEGLSGCVASETSCQCFDSKGLRVDLPDGVCRHQVKQPMISRITGFDTNRKRQSNDPES